MGKRGSHLLYTYSQKLHLIEKRLILWGLSFWGDVVRTSVLVEKAVFMNPFSRAAGDFLRGEKSPAACDGAPVIIL